MKKKTIQHESYILDLTYITKRIIAAGFPAIGIESMWRNNREALLGFVKQNHGTMIKIYNLCGEEGYNYHSEQVGGISMYRFPFMDHNVCSISRIAMFCMDAALFLQRMEAYTKTAHYRQSEDNNGKPPGILVHCKAGKGRTGMMICALLTFINMFPSGQSSIAHYNGSRVRDGNGLTISSQKRYVKFFEGFLYSELILKDSYGVIGVPNWFELYIKRYNKLVENMVFNDMGKH